MAVTRIRPSERGDVAGITPTPEQDIRRDIDRSHEQAGWTIQDVKAINRHANAVGGLVADLGLPVWA